MSKVTASMAGNVWKILVKKGDAVANGQEVAIIESMKMEIPITADREGRVKEVTAGEGDFVNEGDPILELE
ncbi:acetyl-CoA carboxylase biotin carboxyl carrier protein subunit [Brevibacillus sp. B_LB10_24]|uniref:acetyl-CoA carboxylase biotin carboxyl carrier protein subunit n=1 Tax=Brevibacillus sp. B_LB10_24 TaxID=3380645 RepID=UPI0038BCB7C0